jgi:hypothetical protein
MIKRIHVDQQRIKHNVKVCAKDRLPPISIVTSRGTFKGNKLDILDSNGNVVASVLYRPDNPLGCGARLWIETSSTVTIDEGRATL